MYEYLLPIGSIVKLKGGEDKRLMIMGRIQLKEGDSKIYDYSACYYPEGLIDPENIFFFDHDSIEAAYYIGFQDTEEFAFRARLESLGELTVQDGQIVPVKPADM